jgi:pectin lyase
MLFKFSKNPDGTYMIFPRVSRDACCIEVANGSVAEGANVQIFGPTNHPC